MSNNACEEDWEFAQGNPYPPKSYEEWIYAWAKGFCRGYETAKREMENQRKAEPEDEQ